ncbi:hypothetical protein PIB30_088859 [Stylosanthes scabra]|uniref:Uncharacterized protein n=1 Tax=Stylosanthes scabra TaxID=79078 RepID=A0ABU6RUC6_9FABA|nr:hypothetical protein [Stylosanthes scabra]
MIIYFHETYFGENSKEAEAQASWLAYWTGETLKNRLKQEKKLEVGLLKTAEMRAKKDNLQKKRTKRDAEDSESESESHQLSSTDQSLNLRTVQIPMLMPGMMFMKNHHMSKRYGARKGMIRLLFSQSEDTPLAVAFENIRKRKKQQRGDRNTKKKLSQINEGDETRMFDTFDTVSLGGDDSGNVAVQGSIVVLSQPFNNENEVLQAETEQHEKGNDAEVEGHNATVEGEDAAVKVSPNIEDVVQEELQPEPLVVIIPIQPEQPSKSHADEVGVPPHIVENALPEEIQLEPLDVIIMPIQPEQQSGGTTKVDPDPINIQTPVEPELTLKPWLQAKADTSEDPDMIE